jgi:hypothetical protein
MLWVYGQYNTYLNELDVERSATDDERGNGSPVFRNNVIANVAAENPDCGPS